MVVWTWPSSQGSGRVVMFPTAAAVRAGVCISMTYSPPTFTSEAATTSATPLFGWKPPLPKATPATQLQGPTLLNVRLPVTLDDVPTQPPLNATVKVAAAPTRLNVPLSV